MIDTQNYLVTREVALRTGQQPYKYRTKDGRYVIDSRTLNMIRLTADEFVHGIQGVEPITDEESRTLIAKGGFKLGDDGIDEQKENQQKALKEAVQEEIEEEVVESTNGEEDEPQEKETEIKPKSTKKK